MFTISLCGGGTPGQGRVSIGALVVLHTSVCEGEYTGGTSGGGAGVGNSLLETETSQPHRVMAGGCFTEQSVTTQLEGTHHTNTRVGNSPAGQTQQHRDSHGQSSHLTETWQPEIN